MSADTVTVYRYPCGRVKVTTTLVAAMRDLRFGDGLTIAETARRLGLGRSTVAKYAPGIVGAIPNAPLREAFLASGRTASEVAFACGYTNERIFGGKVYVTADTSRLRRRLGLLEHTSTKNGRRYRSRMTTIDAEAAATIAEAIGVAPWEIGA